MKNNIVKHPEQTSCDECILFDVRIGHEPDIKNNYMKIVPDNRRIAKNTIFLYIRMLTAMIVSLYTTRVVLRTLGVEDYGVFTTVAGFVTMFTFLNSTLSVSMQRFYNFEVARQGLDGFKKVYSTGMAIHFIVVLIIVLVLESIGMWYVNNVMVLPIARLTSANIVFQTSVISLCFLLLAIPYSGAIMAAERMDFYAIACILETILKLLCVLALPYLPFDKLSVYGILLLIVSIISFLLYYIYAKKYIFTFRGRLKCDKELLKQMISFSSWNFVGTFSFMLKGQALNMLLNFFFGPIINAARGIAFQVGNAVSSFSSNITVAFRPQLVMAYSQEDYSRVNSLFFIQSKICFALMTILIIPVILNIDYILRIWLGKEVPQYTALFSILVLLDALISSLNTPCTQVVMATGNIKDYQIASSCINIMLFPTCWLFLYLGFDPASVFIITIVFSILNQAVCVWRLLKVFNMSLAKYVMMVIMPCVIFAILCPVPGYIITSVMDHSFIRLCILIVVSIAFGLMLTYYLFFTKSERVRIMNFIGWKNKQDAYNKYNSTDI